MKTSYCEAMGISIELFSEGVRDMMEVEMKKTVTDKVVAIHPYKLPTEEDFTQKGRCKTYVDEPNNKYGRKPIYATSYDEMIMKLYDHYYGSDKKQTFEDVFYQMIEHHSANQTVREGTIKDHLGEYKRFFKDDAFVKKPLAEITVSDMAFFLDRAHLKVSKNDIRRNMKVIEKHRHRAIGTLINLVYSYANRYLMANLINPLPSIDYHTYPFYDQDKLEKTWYDEKERIALLNAWDSIQNLRISDLCVGFLLETGGRNSECRGFRFEDYHFEANEPYVRICGIADFAHRDDRVKADSFAGKRNLPMTERLIKIYDKAKELSWSDTYMFVMDPKYVHDDAILIPHCSLERGLKRLCKKTSIQYLPPHQIRFSDATLMADQGCSTQDIQNHLGHTGPEMSNHYIRRREMCKPAAGPRLSQDVSNKNTPNY